MSKALVSEKESIGIVNFEPFSKGSEADKQQVGAAIIESFQRCGFVYLINHPLSNEKIAEMFDWSKKFFELPFEKKMLAPHPESGTHHRGYSPPGMEKVVQHIYDKQEASKERVAVPDVKESFECGRGEENGDMANIWLPDGILPGFKEACLDFFWTCYKAELDILRALAVGFNLPEEYFVSKHQAPDCQLRLLHYPSIPEETLKNETSTRIGAHSDFGSITLLMQDEVGGLEIEDPNNTGSFIPAPYVQGSLIVNAGDFLARWSNDFIRSTVHRVRAPTGKSANGVIPDRYSIPFFCSADFGTVVDCIPGTWSEENPKKYEPISARDYIMKRLEMNY